MMTWPKAAPACALVLLTLAGAARRARADEHPPSAAELAALLAPLHRLVDALNAAAPTMPADVFTADATVLDDFAPYHWGGRSNAGAWYAGLVGANPLDYRAFVAMHPKLETASPRFTRISGDTAYLVVAATFQFDTAPGRRTRQTAEWIMTEQKISGNWRMAGHAWAITGESPASAH